MGWVKYKTDLKNFEKRVLLDSAKMRIVMNVMDDSKHASTNEVLKELLIEPEFVTKGKIIGSGCFGELGHRHHLISLSFCYLVISSTRHHPYRPYRPYRPVTPPPR